MGRAREIAQELSNHLLMGVENLWLRIHGRNKVGPDAWDPPSNYPFERTRVRKGLRQGHAVNSQKQLVYNYIRSRIAKKVPPTNPFRPPADPGVH